VLITAGILVFIALFMQLYVMSLFATKGAELSEYESKKEQLVAENKRLEQEIASIRNVEYIKERSANAGYVDINHKEVSYLVVK
jgi:cell division protein FtsB